MSIEVAVTAAERGRGAVKPIGYLGPDLFRLYRDACHRGGADYDKASKTNRFPLTRLDALRVALEQAGFSVLLDKGLADSVNERKAEAAALVADALRRLERVQSRLPEEKKIRPYQIYGIKWICSRLRALLGDDMGLGKTLQILVALPDRCRVVWVCPASLKYKLEDEASLWRPGEFRVTPLEGMKSFRWPEENEIVVLNYDILPGKVTGSKKRPTFEGLPDAPPAGAPLYLVADEIHAVKGGTTRRARLFKALAKIVRKAGGATWGATGTEMLNAPPELWNILDALDLAKDAFGDYPSFAKLMGGTEGAFGYQWNGQRRNEEVVKRLRAVSLKRMKRDILKEIPPKQYDRIRVDLSTKERLACDALVEHLAKKGTRLEDIHDAVELTRIKGANLEEFSRALAALAAAKTRAAVELVEQYEEQGVPLMFASSHRAPVDVIGTRKGWAKITGDEPPPLRAEIERRFQAGELKGVAGTIRAIGVGLTLTRSANLLRAGRDFSPAMNTQLEDRICRLGQKADSVLVTDLVADHALDYRIDDVLGEKSERIASTTEAAALTLEEHGDPLLDIPAAPVVESGPPVEGDIWRTTATGARIHITAPAPPSAPAEESPRRPARTALERWAGAGLVHLSALDPDHAGVVNGAGFSKFDGEFGHKLALRVQTRGLTDKEWAAAISLARKYRRQLPPEPAQ